MMEQNLQGHCAGFVSRLSAFVIDVLLVTATLSVASWFVVTVGTLFRLDDLFGTILGRSTLISVGTILVSLVGTLFVVGYPAFFWVLTGQTPGMILLGLRVVATDGGRVSFWRAVRRLIGYVLAALPLFIGFLWVLVDDRRQGWHDKVAGTYVVYAWAAHPDETPPSHPW